jgi:protein-tyrosine phosphatase
MDTMKRPISESYWVEPGRLLAGEYPGRYEEEQTRRRIDAFIEEGFNVFIDLTKPNEVYPYAHLLLEQSGVYDLEVTYHRFPIGDFGLPTPELMKSILDMIDAELQAGKKLYLHCWGGIGRTGTTVGCYLVRHGKTSEESLRQLAEWWREVQKIQFHPYSPETHEQREFIRKWREHEHKSRDNA